MEIIECIKLRLKKRKRAMKIAATKSEIPPYLKKDVGAELNYKLWTTKGARFEASSKYY